MSRKAGDHRPIGNVNDRRRREAWLIHTFGSNNGKWVFCHHCGKRMMAVTPSGRRRWEIDRWPLCGHDGGRYTRNNIVISCKPCNVKRCGAQCRRGALAVRWSAIECNGKNAVEKAA